MSKKILISFATNPKWYRSQNFLIQSAKKHGFDGYINYTDKNTNFDFAKQYENIHNVRGFGYWKWKSHLLLETISQLKENDILAYIDSGNCIINNLDYVFKTCNEQGIVLFDNRDGNYERTTHKNKTWTKRDCFVLMGCDNVCYYDAPQVDASYQFYKKTPETINFLNEYKLYCSNDNIISDLPNSAGKDDLPEFRDHRHDQSVLTNLAVKHNIPLLPEPSEWGNYLTDRPYPQLFWHHRGVF